MEDEGAGDGWVNEDFNPPDDDDDDQSASFDFHLFNPVLKLSYLSFIGVSAPSG